ncbi:MAG: hypothetical protein ACD_3C00043G0023 [uncultured bacterium (gcode 4)]|uniref:Uncharacterized protein n=1 Tax=uncultured bacterium (gcode 4) TaxID=1234023 RepID=K2GED0_9BACT|nr:MAG: hypothetical protein ACD_3C00043G0023 [uncultured bacterium (gcode 4)]
MGQAKNASEHIPSKDLLKARVIYEKLPEDEKRVFEEEISRLKPENKLSERLLAIFTTTRTNIGNALKRSRLTKVTINNESLAEKIISGERSKSSKNMLIDIENNHGSKEEIHLKIEELSKLLSEKFNIDSFVFLELIFDNFFTFFHYLLSVIYIDANKIFPEFKNKLNKRKTTSSRMKYFEELHGKDYINKIESDLIILLMNSFPNIEKERILEFIIKISLVEEIVDLQDAIKLRQSFN